MIGHSKRLLAVAVAAALVPSARLLAQGEGLEEILVTAQRREQSLQDVPISVTAITGEAIEQGGFSDVEDLSIFVPNLFMRDAFTGQSLIVRGIGTSTGNEAFEQAVAAFSDGVYYGRDNLSQGAVFDLERVEVVRGPQPTFAGQSATAGAINVITRRPGETWEGGVNMAYGSDEESTLDFAAGGPLSDNFGIRFAGRCLRARRRGLHVDHRQRAARREREQSGARRRHVGPHRQPRLHVQVRAPRRLAARHGGRIHHLRNAAEFQHGQYDDRTGPAGAVRARCRRQRLGLERARRQARHGRLDGCSRYRRRTECRERCGARQPELLGQRRRRSATSRTGSIRSPSTTSPRTATSKPTSCSLPSIGRSAT